MKLTEIAVPEYKFYLDLDGVVFDFVKGVNEILNIDRDSMSNTQFYKVLEKALANGVDVYNRLPVMHDFPTLWAYIKHHDPTILTSTGHRLPQIIKKQKEEQVAQTFPPHIKMITVEHSYLKAEYAAPNHILIDDRAKSIDPWKEKGGIGILHTSAESTIKQLKDLGL